MGESYSLVPFAMLDSKEGMMVINPKLMSILEERKIVDTAPQNPITPP